jgi:hypothetical protein
MTLSAPSPVGNSRVVVLGGSVAPNAAAPTGSVAGSAGPGDVVGAAGAAEPAAGAGAAAEPAAGAAEPEPALGVGARLAAGAGGGPAGAPEPAGW